MTHLTDTPRDSALPDVQVLIEEARRHKRRRHRLRLVRSVLVIATAVAVLGVGIYIAHPASPGAHPSRSPSSPVSGARTGATLVYSFSNLRVINADTGALTPTGDVLHVSSPICVTFLPVK